MRGWGARGDAVGRHLRAGGSFLALAPLPASWIMATEMAAGGVSRSGIGVPLAARCLRGSEVDIFPLPLPLAEPGPHSGRSRKRWAMHRYAWWWVCIQIATLNALHGCRSSPLRVPSQAQDRLLGRLREEIRQLLREACKLSLGGEQFIREFVHAHLDEYDRFAHVLPLDWVACGGGVFRPCQRPR